MDEKLSISNPLWKLYVFQSIGLTGTRCPPTPIPQIMSYIPRVLNSMSESESLSRDILISSIA